MGWGGWVGGVVVVVVVGGGALQQPAAGMRLASPPSRASHPPLTTSCLVAHVQDDEGGARGGGLQPIDDLFRGAAGGRAGGRGAHGLAARPAAQQAAATQSSMQGCSMNGPALPRAGGGAQACLLEAGARLGHDAQAWLLFLPGRLAPPLLAAGAVLRLFEALRGMRHKIQEQKEGGPVMPRAAGRAAGPVWYAARKSATLTAASATTAAAAAAPSPR